MKKKSKKILSIVLAVVLCITAVPVLLSLSRSKDSSSGCSSGSITNKVTTSVHTLITMSDMVSSTLVLYVPDKISSYDELVVWLDENEYDNHSGTPNNFSVEFAAFEGMSCSPYIYLDIEVQSIRIGENGSFCTDGYEKGPSYNFTCKFFNVVE